MKARGRFHFSLATVLRVRSLREEQARLELARTLMLLERSRQALKDTERRLAQHLAALHRSAAQAMDGKDYQLHFAYLHYLKDALQGWRSRLAQEEAEAGRQKLKLRQLHQERRLLANLREKKLARFNQVQARTLEKETETVVLLRWSRR